MNDDLSKDRAFADPTVHYLRRALTYWTLLAIAFNLIILAENAYYHEDLLGHLARHWDLLIVFAAVANGTLSAAALLESYWCILIRPPRPTWGHLFRLVVFALILGFHIHLIRTFYLWHPTPHHPY